MSKPNAQRHQANVEFFKKLGVNFTEAQDQALAKRLEETGQKPCSFDEMAMEQTELAQAAMGKRDVEAFKKCSDTISKYMETANEIIKKDFVAGLDLVPAMQLVSIGPVAIVNMGMDVAVFVGVKNDPETPKLQ